jgi:hypothetical protein
LEIELYKKFLIIKKKPKKIKYALISAVLIFLEFDLRLFYIIVYFRKKKEKV